MDESSDIDDDNPSYKRPPQETIISTPVKLEVKATSEQKDEGDIDLLRPTTPAEEKQRPEPNSREGSSPIKDSNFNESESEEEESESESKSDSSTESLDYSADSARGDSILPTMDDSSYSQSKKHPRFVLMDPQEGSTKGNLQIDLIVYDILNYSRLLINSLIDIYLRSCILM